MAVKLLMSWDIRPDREQEYFEFVVREFIPGVQRLGFELSDAWATVFGDHPQILVGAVASSASKARQILQSDEWKALNDQLQDFVKNYSFKIVEARGGFQF
ncbi:MAG: hypothetical protein ACPLUL_10985 [Thermanaerothrix sp.]|uniref:Uncharacterized protein n=1 Tax=Thermanaerothrix solaris TaxID=3058434 RepID=A0ABU3NRF6_9CHLR|nr:MULTISPECIES: hypothetical protein [unclassified Thermanaerothrix]MCX8024585.1 hypothetical protein [Thermanaerothrix sp.]MDT8898788.1 hypothetical protein [Thermanaerothrix sp. 4228-RoL]